MVWGMGFTSAEWGRGKGSATIGCSGDVQFCWKLLSQDRGSFVGGAVLPLDVVSGNSAYVLFLFSFSLFLFFSISNNPEVN